MLSGSARADEPPADPRAAAPAPTTAASAAPAPPVPAASSTAAPGKDDARLPPVPQSPTSEKRSETLEPRPVYQPSTLNGARLQADPIADGAVFLAPHPGQGRLLLACIDPSVADEADPLSVVPELDPFNAANGFFGGLGLIARSTPVSAA